MELMQRARSRLRFAAAGALLAAALCASPCAFAASSTAHNGIASAADTLRNEYAPLLPTFDKLQANQEPTEGIDISGARVQGLQDVMYTGVAEDPTITLKLDKETLREGRDFDVEFVGDAVNPGTVTVIITGKDAYTGTIETGFTILPGDLSHATIDVIPDQTAVGDNEPLCPQPTVKLNGNALQEGTDYTVSYADNIDEGTATLVVTGTGNCFGEARTTFEVVYNPNASQQQSARAALPLLALAIAAGAASLAILVALVRKNKRVATP